MRKICGTFIVTAGIENFLIQRALTKKDLSQGVLSALQSSKWPSKSDCNIKGSSMFSRPWIP